MIKLETPRLFIRHFLESDAEFVVSICNTPGWLKFIGDRYIHTNRDAVSYLQKGPFMSYSKFGYGLSGVELKSSGKLIGMCGLIKRDVLEHTDIGFAFLPEFGGSGYALEAAKAILQEGFSTHGLNRIDAITDPENERSISLLEKLGMRLEKQMLIPGDQKEVLLFSLEKKS